MMVVVGIVGVLAALAFSVSRAAARNVYLRQAANELAMRATGLRTTALGAGQDHLLVVVDAPGNDASQCGMWNSVSCARYFILSSPTAGWTLAAFDPALPTANASLVDTQVLPKGARFFLAPAYPAPPAPFANVAVFDARFTASCGGSRCFAIRFTQTGTVRAEQPGGGSVRAPGFAFVLASDAEIEGAGGDHRGVLIGFPTGVVKSFAYSL
jgi:type II secretory pathway pseudopilin PulG